MSGEGDLNLLALLREPSPGELAGPLPSGFGFAGFDMVDVHGLWAIWRWRDPEDPGGSGSPENH